MGDPTKMRIDLSRGIIELECESEDFQKYLGEVRDFVKDVSSKRQVTVSETSDVEEVFQEMPGQLALLSSTDSATPKRVAVEVTSQELREFIDALNLHDSEMEYVLAFTYYLVEKRRWPSVTITDLEDCYRLAKRKVPRIEKAISNASYRYQTLSKDSKGQVILTREGRNFIEFPDSRSKSPSGSQSKSDAVGKQVKAKGSSAPRNLKPNANIDLYGGEGKEKFSDYVARKNPKDNKDRIAVSAAYLLYVLGSDSFDEDDIYTCFVDQGWKSPEFLRNNIINHKNLHVFYQFNDDKTGFIGTMRLKNYVDHDLK